jgi:sterol desaturase/sphingolipid hydroxylase (fatty acid hydroxylase superfamily)
MKPWWLEHVSSIYQSLLVVAFLGAATWESFRPRQRLVLPASRRWLLHGLFVVLADVTTALVFRANAVIVASTVSSSPYGVLNRASIPFPLRALLTFLFLDFVNYADHYLRHAIPLLWRFHRVHHSDSDFDFSTGLRFHPGEVLFTQGIYLLAIAVAAPPASVVLCFEACNIVQAFFSHANVSLPPRVERVLQSFQVTPQLHEIHHSQNGAAQRSNLGVLFSFWDRLFRTYQPSPDSSEQRLRIGLSDVTPTDSMRPWAMLALPFERGSFATTRAATRQQEELTPQ